MLVTEMNRLNRHSEGSRKDSVGVLFLKLGPYQDHPLAFGLLVDLKRSKFIWILFLNTSESEKSEFFGIILDL